MISKAGAMKHVQKLLENVGFIKFPPSKSFPLMILSNDRDCSKYVRFFSPQILTYPNQKDLVGVLGSMINPFLVEKQFLNRIGNLFVVSVFSENFSELREMSTLFVSDERDLLICKKIHDVSLEFPTNDDQLEEFKNKDSICGFDTKKMYYRKSEDTINN